MARLLIHVEGQTEETFVNELLRDHLVAVGYHSVEARILGNARLRRQRGGIRSWPTVRKDILNHLLGDPNCVAATIVDYYGLPDAPVHGWPGKASAPRHGTAQEKARHVETALASDLALDDRFDPRRFVPFVMMHEFEGMLFSDCTGFSRGIYQPSLRRQLQEIRDQFATPEDINDSADTAPSKRIEQLVPGYQKPLLGILAALEIGLDSIRAACPHFNAWLISLENIAKRA